MVLRGRSPASRNTEAYALALGLKALQNPANSLSSCASHEFVHPYLSWSHVTNVAQSDFELTPLRHVRADPVRQTMSEEISCLRERVDKLEGIVQDLFREVTRCHQLVDRKSVGSNWESYIHGKPLRRAPKKLKAEEQPTLLQSCHAAPCQDLTLPASKSTESITITDDGPSLVAPDLMALRLTLLGQPVSTACTEEGAPNKRPKPNPRFVAVPCPPSPDTSIDSIDTISEVPFRELLKHKCKPVKQPRVAGDIESGSEEVSHLEGAEATMEFQSDEKVNIESDGTVQVVPWVRARRGSKDTSSELSFV